MGPRRMDNVHPQQTPKTKAARPAWKRCPMPGCKRHLVCCSAGPCCSVTLIPHLLAQTSQAWLRSSQITRKAAHQQAGCASSREEKTCGSRVLKVPERSSVYNPSSPHQQGQAVPTCRARRCDCQRPYSRVVLLSRPACDPPHGSSELLGLHPSEHLCFLCAICLCRTCNICWFCRKGPVQGNRCLPQADPVLSAHRVHH